MSKCPFHAPRYPIEARDVTSKDIDGISDLVVWAPIKDGFIDAFANVTYETRLRAVAEALHKVRKNVREFQLIEPFADTAKRILSLLDFRIGIVDRDIYGYNKVCPESGDKPRLKPQKFMYLVATFDGPWEPYMRLIWHPLGTFLDLVLCNCEGYITAQEHSFEEYAQWVREHQLDSAIFYSTSGLTVKDKIYLEQLERAQREMLPEQSDLYIAKMTSDNPDDQAKEIQNSTDPHIFIEVLRLGLEALNVLYKLTHLYPHDTNRAKGDGWLLHQAAKDFLQHLNFTDRLKKLSPDTARAIRKNYLDPLAWYETPEKDRDILPHESTMSDFQIQKGILTSYDDASDAVEGKYVSNAALLLIKIDDANLAKQFFQPELWSWEDDSPEFECSEFNNLFRNIGFTFNGLKKLNLSDEELNAFPKEFREGMANRAPLIGDIHHNHPLRWKLPKRNWPKKIISVDPPVVSLSEVDLFVQLRSTNPWNAFLGPGYIEFDELADRLDSKELREIFADMKKGQGQSIRDLDLDAQNHDLKKDKVDADFNPISPEAFAEFFCSFLDVVRQKNKNTVLPMEGYILFLEYFKKELGVSIICVENTYRPDVKTNPNSKAVSANVDHFKFLDGVSQPIFKDSLNYQDQKRLRTSHPLEVKHGDVVYGHPNLLGDYTPAALSKKKIQLNGSFLAIRKMKQDVKAFEEFLNKYKDKIDPEKLASKLVGRKKDGDPLITSKNNDFDYSSDEEGELCPFSSHIRRANPRSFFHDRKSPKIVRRGMSYGKRFDDDPKGERGIIFMAYCSNLAEHYETIQRWVNGANSTDKSSSEFDPLLSPLPKDGHRIFRYMSTGNPMEETKVHRVKIDRPFVTLEWGSYAFAPSRSALCDIVGRKQVPANSFKSAYERGKQVFSEVQSHEDIATTRMEWKILLEDPLTKDPAHHAITPDVWKYLREGDAKIRPGIIRLETGIAGREKYILSNGHKNDGKNIVIENGVSIPKPAESKAPIESEQPIVLVTDQKLILEVLSDYETFSVKEQFNRVKDVFARIYVAMDPDSTMDSQTTKTQYSDESKITNEFLFGITEEEAFFSAYGFAKAFLDKRKAVFKDRNEFKMELRREYLMPCLAGFCNIFYGVPDLDLQDENTWPLAHIGIGGWAWDASLGATRQARCPGDFLAPSRGTFYPRPTESIFDYSVQHGSKLKSAMSKIVDEWLAGTKKPGSVSAAIVKAAKKLNPKNPDKSLIARNVIGTMTGALPPMDGNLRGILFDWIEEDTLWRYQGAFFREYSDLIQKKVQPEKALYSAAKEKILPGIEDSMRVRPAPDLIYRTALEDIKIGEQEIKKDDMVILSLVSATQASLEKEKEAVQTGKDAGNIRESGVAIVFGGDRKYGSKFPVHACPAQKMAMGGMLGIITALLEAGKIVAQPASLIIEISDWKKPN